MGVYLLSGTPGSGKSLDASRMMLHDLKVNSNTYVITNIPVKIEMIHPNSRDRYKYIPTNLLDSTKYIENIILDYWNNHTAKNRKDAEGRIHFYWDECQLQLNSRTWLANQKKGWPAFFALHRHYGMTIYLITQMQSMLDKQVRGQIEYDIVHRKIERGGLGGWLVSRIFGGGLFIKCWIWNTTRKQFQQDFFIYRKKYGDFFDTFQLFGEKYTRKSIIRFESGVYDEEDEENDSDNNNYNDDCDCKTC